MTWKQAAQALTDPDGLRESLDPFYIPDRTGEAVWFFGATMLVVLILCAPLFVRLTTGNIVLLLGIGVVASFAAFRGLQERRYRLSRMQAVAELRARLGDKIETEGLR